MYSSETIHAPYVNRLNIIKITLIICILNENSLSDDDLNRKFETPTIEIPTIVKAIPFNYCIVGYFPKTILLNIAVVIITPPLNI